MSDFEVIGNSKETFSSKEKNSRKYPIENLSQYKKKWERSLSTDGTYWAEEAKKHLMWGKEFQTVFSREGSVFKWFSDGELNISKNCLDRHLESSPNKLALIWEDESGNSIKYTYKELHKKVCEFSTLLLSLAVKPGDSVTLYLSVSPELVISMLSCARLGLIHNVIFAGFSPDSLGSRIQASSSKIVITLDAFYRKGKLLKLKDIVDRALEEENFAEKVLVFNRGLSKVSMKPGRDFFVDDQLKKEISKEALHPQNFSAEHPLFLLYTSGSTGAPKGLLHTSGGFLLGVKMTLHYLLNIQTDDIFWCTADIGWITGHCYAVYGPLASGATTLLYEGAPFTPDPGRWWELVEKYKVSKLYTAPTAIRMSMAEGDSWVEKYDTSSLNLLACAGEPINQKAWRWFFDVIGKGQCEIIDTWWQTETGSVAIAPFPALTRLKPGCASRPFFGVSAKVLDEKSREIKHGKGALYLEKPMPSMARTIFKDHKRYEQEYWCEKTSYYKTSDAAYLDEDGEIWVLGRIDDVINVSGHRLSTMEIESIFCAHPFVLEASCVGFHDDLTGEALASFLVLSEKACDKSRQELESFFSSYIARSVGAFARPKKIIFLPVLPKTRSGKVMRRILRSLALGKKPEGDFSTLEDPSFLEKVSL